MRFPCPLRQKATCSGASSCADVKDLRCAPENEDCALACSGGAAACSGAVMTCGARDCAVTCAAGGFAGVCQNARVHGETASALAFAVTASSGSNAGRAADDRYPHWHRH